MEDVDYGAITGIHIGKGFDLFHLDHSDSGEGTCMKTVKKENSPQQIFYFTKSIATSVETLCKH